jgi:O-acetylserine/cysteine efflux transporter
VAVIWGLAFVASRIALDEFSPALMTALRFAIAAVPCLFVRKPISTSIAYWLRGRLLRDYTAVQVLPFALLVPFVGAAASTAILGERFGPLRLSGMVIVVCGIAIMLLSKRSQALLGA